MLLIRLTALGDVVLIEPVVRALRAAFPGVRVDLVTEAHHAALMRDAGGLDAVVAYDRRGADAGWRGPWRVAARLPSRRYDLVVDLQGKLRTRVLARRVAAGRRLVLRKRSLGRALLALLGRDPPLTDRHSVDLYLSALAPLWGDAPPALPAPVAPRLDFPPVEAEPGHEHETGRAGAALQIGLCPGTTHATKRWAPERFAALADALADRRPEARFLLVGGPSDRAELDALRGAVRSARLLDEDVAGLDVAGLGRRLSRLDLLVGVDSGPAHLAAASGVPVVAIFGPTSPLRWGPRGPAHRAVSLGLDCAPCSNVGGPRCPRADRDHACLRELEVEPVLEAALSALGAEAR